MDIVTITKCAIAFIAAWYLIPVILFMGIIAVIVFIFLGIGITSAIGVKINKLKSRIQMNKES